MREETARELRDSVDALGAIAGATLDLLDRRLEYPPPPPPPDLNPPRRPLSGLPAILRAVPGLAGEFARSVPAEYVEALPDGSAVISCVCGTPTSLQVGVLEECDGCCGRWFVRTERDVRVAKWEPVELEDRYAGPGWTPREAAA